MSVTSHSTCTQHMAARGIQPTHTATHQAQTHQQSLRMDTPQVVVRQERGAGRGERVGVVGELAGLSTGQQRRLHALGREGSAELVQAHERPHHQLRRGVDELQQRGGEPPGHGGIHHVGDVRADAPRGNGDVVAGCIDGSTDASLWDGDLWRWDAESARVPFCSPGTATTPRAGVPCCPRDPPTPPRCSRIHR